MTFLQPIVLWGLPLIAIPVAIHFLNRMRYRTERWAAMRFLLAATRRSTRHARLREWLVLAARVLAVAALLFAVARPLVGGWLAGGAGAAPESVVLLLDRSPSMELAHPGSRESKRAAALRRFAEAGAAFEGRTRFTLIDSATLQPCPLAGLGRLSVLAAAAPSDAAADTPALFEAAEAHLAAGSGGGRSEIWLATDLQASNWKPEDGRWAGLRRRLAALPSPPRIRLLALTRSDPANAAVSLVEVRRLPEASSSRLRLIVRVSRDGDARGETLPLTVSHQGARTRVEAALTGQNTDVEIALDLGANAGAGWGWIELPLDSNERDNRTYFTYPEHTPLRAFVAARPPSSARILRLAAAPAPGRFGVAAAEAQPESLPDLGAASLVLWQAAAPTGAAGRAIEDFAREGGAALLFASGAGATGDFRVVSWRDTDSVLARAADGTALPLDGLTVARRAALPAGGIPLASFADGEPFLTRQALGKGAIYRCATRVDADWSSLADGRVLVPVVHRLLREGAARLAAAGLSEVGAYAHAEAACVSEPGRQPAFAAGVFAAGGRLTAVNRPRAEDEPERLDGETARGLSGAAATRLFEDAGDARGAAYAEAWRLFLLALLLLLAGEAVLTLPSAAPARSPAGAGAPPAEGAVAP